MSIIVSSKKILFFINFLLLMNNSLSLSKADFQKIYKNPFSKKSSQKIQQSILIDNFFQKEDCSITSKEPISFNDGQQILLPLSNPDGLISYYSFDQSEPIDDSGNGFHAVGKVKAGHAFGGQGSSARFSGGEYVYIPSNEKFNSPDFSITFWMYLLDENMEDDTDICPILYKGKGGSENHGPSISYDGGTRKLKIELYTENKKTLIINSLSRITPKKWYHISLIKSNEYKIMNLTVNGIPDSTLEIGKEKIKYNNDPFYIGNTPDHVQDCHMKYFIDELRFYNKTLDLDYIQAEASIILGGIEPNYFRIGCLGCTLEEAEKSCIEGYKLCTSVEMYTGGYQLARVLGLLNDNNRIWTNQILEEKERYIGKKGLGICCSVIK